MIVLNVKKNIKKIVIFGKNIKKNWRRKNDKLYMGYNTKRNDT